MRRCWAPSTLPAQSCLKVSSDPFNGRDFAEKLNLGFLQKKNTCMHVFRLAAQEDGETESAPTPPGIP